MRALKYSLIAPMTIRAKIPMVMPKTVRPVLTLRRSIFNRISYTAFLHLFQHGVAFNLAVVEMDEALSLVAYQRVVGDDEEGLAFPTVELLHHPYNFPGG